MKSFLTRIGFGSKAVITGDVTQIDLPTGKRSGLVEAERVLANIEGIDFIYFSEKDVVRHKLVQMIIKPTSAYEEERILALAALPPDVRPASCLVGDAGLCGCAVSLGLSP